MTSLVSKVSQGFKNRFIEDIKEVPEVLARSLKFGVTSIIPHSAVTAIFVGLSQSSMAAESPTCGFAARNFLLLGAAATFSRGVFSFANFFYWEPFRELEAKDKEVVALQKKANPSCAKAEEKKDSPVQIEKVAKEVVKTEMTFALKV